MLPRSTIAFSLTFACGLVHLSTASAQPATQTDAKKVTPTIEAIDQAISRFVDRGTIAGAVTLVGHQGKIVHLGAVGWADLEKRREMKPGTLFSIASMTKPIVATAVMMLQDEGKLNVEDEVVKYVPALAELKLNNGDSPERPITIRDAITHTAGLSGSQLFQGSLADAVEKELAGRPLAFQPGTKWKYSPGLNVAGRVIEVVSSQPLDQFLKERLFTPLKMNQTTFFPTDKQKRRVAVIYGPAPSGNEGDNEADGENDGKNDGKNDDENQTRLVPAGNRITDSAQGPNPSGGLFSTARDLFRFYKTILNRGRFNRNSIVSAEAIRQMTTPQTGDLETGFTPGNAWGLGWCVIREPQGVSGTLSPGSFGHGGAFGTQAWLDPKTDTVYLLLIQRTGLPNSDGSEIRKTFQQVASDSIAALTD